VNPFALNRNQVDNFAIVHEFATETTLLFQEPFVEKAEPLPKIVALNTTQVYQRMMNQHSRFTIHGTKTPLNTLSDADQFVFKLVIPSTAKACIQQELLRMGIRLSILFPDLEHLAKDILEYPYVT